MNSKHIPTLGNLSQPTFAPQFQANTDARSLASTPVEFFDNLNGALLSNVHASGFFYRHGERVFLTSARHVLTGLDAFTDEPISKETLFLPRKVLVFPTVKNADGFSFRLKDGIEVQIRSSDDQPLWLQDPAFATLRTDIACAEIDHPQRSQFWCVNDCGEENLLANVGFDCFILGYPIKSYAQPYHPIWRHGSFAYEPGYPVDDRPIFLLDARTSKGMSGAAIYQRWQGPAPIFSATDGVTMKLDNVVTSRFVGVYGGRLSGSSDLADVGYGWYANRIPLIVAKPKAGAFSPWSNASKT